MVLGNRKLIVDAEKYHICHVCDTWNQNFGLMSMSYLDDFNHMYSRIHHKVTKFVNGQNLDIIIQLSVRYHPRTVTTDGWWNIYEISIFEFWGFSGIFFGIFGDFYGSFGWSCDSFVRQVLWLQYNLLIMIIELGHGLARGHGEWAWPARCTWT